jgi:tetratricopeptide (TPR) repeat protein
MTPTKRIGLIVVVAIVCLSIAVAFLRYRSANAAAQMQFVWCANEDHSYSPDLQVDGCTALMQSKSFSDEGVAQLLSNRGNAYNAKEDYGRAFADYSEAIRVDPKFALAYNNRGAAYNRKGDHERAMVDLNEAIRLDPKYAIAFLNRGNSYLGKDDYSRAIGEYNEAIRLDPKYANAYANRGNAYALERNYDRAIADYTESIRLNPTFAATHLNRGKSYFYKRDYDHAIADYGEVILLNPRSAAAYANRARAYDRKGNYDQAIDDLNSAILLDPGNAGYLNSRCWSRALFGRDLHEALTDCDASFRLRPDDPDVLGSRGLVQLRLNAFDKSIKDYSLVLAQRGRDADALYGRGLAKLKSGDAEGGDADISAAKAIQADIAEAHAWLGSESATAQ